MKPAIIGITGPLGGGKTTLANILVEQHGYHRYRFAGILKDMIEVLGVSRDQIDGKLKNDPDDKLLCGKTPRWAMQSLGTEWGRKCIGEDIWVNATMEKINRFRVSRRVPTYIVIDDVRFPNEVRAINAAGGFIVKIHGRDPNETEWDSKGWLTKLFSKKPHLSEIYWSKIIADHTIFNGPDMDLAFLREEAKDMLEKLV